MKAKQTKGRLILTEVQFDQLYKRTVNKNNDSSGKVTLPKNLIGKRVYVVVEPNS